MGLVIHDLNADQWDKISGAYREWTVVSETEPITPCTGCFACWNKEPGCCAVKDGYSDMGYLIHHADEVTVISRYTYGGFSGSVKGIFDRCLGYVLPQFEVVNGETHHKKRYDEDKPFTFIFYGCSLSEEEKESARRYVRAVCANIRGRVKDVIFRECEDGEASALKPSVNKTASSGKTVLLNGSMRSAGGNSAKFAGFLDRQLSTETETVALKDHRKDMAALVRRLEDAPAIVLCVPLYVDGLPSMVIRLFESFEAEYRGGSKRIYLLANMGLYESGQLISLFTAVKQWCEKMGFEYCGGLGISAGELLGALIDVLPPGTGPNRDAARGIKRLAEAINSASKTDDIFAEPYAFPRLLYILIANTNWNITAKRNGLDPKDLYRRL